jgi:hypothetical protein
LDSRVLLAAYLVEGYDSVNSSIGSSQGSVRLPILFACFINDVGDHVRNCRFHLYANDLQIDTVDGCGDVNRLVALVNGDLQRILDWSRVGSLILNASKTQALLVSRRIRQEDVGSDVILGGDSVRLLGENSWAERGWSFELEKTGQLCTM